MYLNTSPQIELLLTIQQFIKEMSLTNKKTHSLELKFYSSNGFFNFNTWKTHLGSPKPYFFSMFSHHTTLMLHLASQVAHEICIGIAL